MYIERQSWVWKTLEVWVVYHTGPVYAQCRCHDFDRHCLALGIDWGSLDYKECLPCILRDCPPHLNRNKVFPKNVWQKWYAYIWTSSINMPNDDQCRSMLLKIFALTKKYHSTQEIPVQFDMNREIIVQFQKHFIMHPVRDDIKSSYKPPIHSIFFLEWCGLITLWEKRLCDQCG